MFTNSLGVAEKSHFRQLRLGLQKTVLLDFFRILTRSQHISTNQTSISGTAIGRQLDISAQHFPVPEPLEARLQDHGNAIFERVIQSPHIPG